MPASAGMTIVGVMPAVVDVPAPAAPYQRRHDDRGYGSDRTSMTAAGYRGARRLTIGR